MLEEFKTQMLYNFSLKTDTMKIKRRQEEVESALIIFFPKFTSRNPINECQLHVIKVFLVCEENHATYKRPYLVGLKDVYQREEGGAEKLFN